MGISVSVFGVIWFAFATLMSLVGLSGSPAARESAPGYLFAASTLGLAVVLYLGYASFVILNLVCVLCVITYAAVIAIFLVSGAATSVPMMSLPRRAAHDLRTLVSSPLAIALAVLFVGGAASALAFFPRESARDAAAVTPAAETADQAAARISEFERWYTSQPRVPLIVPAEGAKVLIVKFNDYQCPACGQSYTEYKSIFAKYQAEHPGDIRLVLKDFPLEQECNSTMTTSMHGGACEAAAAVRLARAKNRAEALEEWLYSNQSQMTPDRVKQAAKDIGQVQDFDSRYGATLEAVKADVAYGRQLGVRSTPTFFINGVKLEGALPAVYFDQAIAYELAHAGAK
jgi:protein-disulfide isomerase